MSHPAASPCFSPIATPLGSPSPVQGRVIQAKSRPRPVPRTASPRESGAAGPARSSGPGPASPCRPLSRPNQAVAGQEVLRGLSSWPPREPVPALPPTHPHVGAALPPLTTEYTSRRPGLPMPRPGTARPVSVRMRPESAPLLPEIVTRLLPRPPASN